MRAAGRRAALPIIVVTVVAGTLRFAQLQGVSPNPFYDAAVRSMTLSWHNFFFGAFDPSATLSIDKPPLDLWLQVVSVKLFGRGRFSLQLPEALAGTLSIPLLYDAVRRVVGRPAGLAAVLALAVLSIAVWIAFGLLAFDTMHTVHARYLEALAPALAATIGFGRRGSRGWLASQPGRMRWGWPPSWHAGGPGSWPRGWPRRSLRRSGARGGDRGDRRQSAGQRRAVARMRQCPPGG